MTNKNSKIILTVAMLVLLASAGVFARNTITLTGSVPSILEITATATAAASTLDLTANEPGLTVGNVVERSNKKAGYTVSVTSANAAGGAGDVAFFKSADAGNTDTLNYSITYGKTAVTLSGGSDALPSVAGKTSVAGTSNAVVIAYDGSALLLYEDTYSDTLTFTISSP